MKKLLLALPLLLAVVMVGCKKPQKDDPTKIQSLTLRPEKATIAEGGDISLTVIAQPAGLKGEYTWASSDTTVAAVDKLVLPISLLLKQVARRHRAKSG